MTGVAATPKMSDGANKDLGTRALVTLLLIGAVAGLVLCWDPAAVRPGFWNLFCFFAAAFLLDQAGSPLRVDASGSTSFILHMAAGILFGPFWGGLIAGTSMAASQIVDRRPMTRILFNGAQRCLCVIVGLWAYSALGGALPPSYLRVADLVSRGELQRDLGLFLVFAAVYFAVNTVAVSAVISLNTSQRFKDVWNLNARGVLGYDLAASLIAALLAWLYVKFEMLLGFGVLGFIIVLAPILAIRHIYGLYRRLQNSGRELLDLMVKAIEARDPYTSGHSVRVATLAKAIAIEAKMSTEQVDQVYTAALLHDVGKIHEEFAPLLRKESKLTPEETALLQSHPVKSAELVGIISSFRGRVQSSVRSHHERWDGGGYPDGLVGEQIPLGARIIMISDTTDAMTTDRPYRKRLTIDAVVSELQKYRSTQFDPQLVDLVVSSIAIRRVMADLQGSSDGPTDKPIEGGSKRVTNRRQGLLSGRPSWPRVKAF